MNQDEKANLIKAWHESAKEDLATAQGLFNLGRYNGSLFFGQLVLEKMLKAIFLRTKDASPPYTHKLAKLAQDSSLKLNKQQIEHLNEISTFNIEARYDILKEKLYKKATKDFTSKYLTVIKELFNYFQNLL